LELEPAGRCGGLDLLLGAPQAHAECLKPVVGVHYIEQRTSYPVELVAEEALEVASPGLL
jgi:hypothetical protein